MIKIYHNPRCRKSREALELLKESGKEYEVVKYLEEIPTKEELREVLNCLSLKAENLVRKNEPIWKEKFKGKLLSEEDIINAMIAYPKLIERPIVIEGGKAIIGRPPERVQEML
ncbi:arsenate reductase (glutaredoxin) [Sediminicola sp. 1XM1-17]|uniref:arsenate reductase (glutaredoxin) n=1 Tax=Sediminicola sp. 1XM1-17 TaxID=3127702 RepID=UPI00307822F3